MRVCEVCRAHQLTYEHAWPHFNPICPGDNDDPPTRISGRKPRTPPGGADHPERELELA
jgi:hypothetical protein